MTDGGPAFPSPLRPEDGFWNAQGMSLRDWFAGQALPGAIEDYDRKRWVGGSVATESMLPYAAQATGAREDIIARQAYRYADAMLAERARTSTEGRA